MDFALGFVQWYWQPLLLIVLVSTDASIGLENRPAYIKALAVGRMPLCTTVNSLLLVIQPSEAQW
jgi:hypothetical protein